MPARRGSAHHPELAEVEMVTVFAALADPVRLAIIRTLAEVGEQPWSQFDLPIAPSTLSHHLKVLRHAGLIRSRTEGTRCFVSLRRDELDQRFPGLVATVLRES